MTDRVRCFSADLERVFSGYYAQNEAGAPVREPDEAVRLCLERGGEEEAAQMRAEVSRLQGVYPDWSGRLREALSIRLETAARQPEGQP